MNLIKSRRARQTLGVGVAVAACIALTMSAGPANAASTAQTDSGGKITVWVDPPRVPAANAFKKAYPNIPINIVQINGTVGGQSKPLRTLMPQVKVGQMQSSSPPTMTSLGQLAQRAVTPLT